MVNLKRTKEDILKATIEAVHRQGLTATSLNQLFALSGASSGSFYNYFRSKQELGHALIDYEWELLSTSVLEPAYQDCPDPVDRVLAAIDRLEAKNLERQNCAGCLLGNLVVDLVERDPSYREHLTQIFDRWERAFADAFAEAGDRWRSGTDPHLLAEQLLIVIEGTMLMGRLRRDSDRIRRGFASARQLVRQALQ